MDIRNTFLKLTSSTYPHPSEDGVLDFLPTLKKDRFGNYYKIIGESESIFACHLDTADRNQSKVNHVFETDNVGDDWISSDGTTILGADDKAGVVVLMYMIENNIPGIYYFFIGEEVGLIGSGKVSDSYDSFKLLQNVKRIISFDRKSYSSIITSQMGRPCCSSEFAEYLISEYVKYGLDMEKDDTGIVTDSAMFMDKIPECTNISVGYFYEHSVGETQNISFLEDLCKSSIKVDWENSPIVRNVNIDDFVYNEHKDIIRYIENMMTNNEIHIYEELNMLCISLVVEDLSTSILMGELEEILIGLEKYKSNYYTEIESNKIKIYVV